MARHRTGLLLSGKVGQENVNYLKIMTADLKDTEYSSLYIYIYTYVDISIHTLIMRLCLYNGCIFVYAQILCMC